MKIRELEMPSKHKLDELSSFLADFYLKNIISTSQLKRIYETYYKFKEHFLNKYPGNIVKIGKQNTRKSFKQCKLLFMLRCKRKHVRLYRIGHLL